MSKSPLHDWNLKPEAAIALQRELAQRIVREDQLGEVRCVAGVDMALNEESGMARAAVVLLSYPDLEILERHVYEEPVRMPYIPGLLSFRGDCPSAQVGDCFTPGPLARFADDWLWQVDPGRTPCSSERGGGKLGTTN